jgi:predicted DNA-binding transcriptional regulator AlpA
MTRLGISELETRLGVTRRTIARWVAEGKLPRQHYVGSHRKWFETEIAAAEAGLAAPRGQPHRAPRVQRKATSPSVNSDCESAKKDP